MSRARSFRVLAVVGLLACVLAGCAAGPDPDRARWLSWIDETAPTEARGGSLAGLAGSSGDPADAHLALSDPEPLVALELGCTGTGTMAFSVTLRARADGGEKTDTFLHDIVCSNGMATPLAAPRGYESVTAVSVAVSSSDGRGAWRVTLDEAP